MQSIQNAYSSGLHTT